VCVCVCVCVHGLLAQWFFMQFGLLRPRCKKATDLSKVMNFRTCIS